MMAIVRPMVLDEKTSFPQGRLGGVCQEGARQRKQNSFCPEPFQYWVHSLRVVLYALLLSNVGTVVDCDCYPFSVLVG